MKRKILSLLAITGIVFFFASCEYEYIEPKVTPTPPADDTISFSQDIIPFFTSDCASCHGGSIAPDLRAANAYSSLSTNALFVAGDPTNSTIYKVCKVSGSMNGYVKDQGSVDLLYRWIYAGAKNN